MAETKKPGVEKPDIPKIPDDPKSAYERLMDEDGHERGGAPLAPHQNRLPGEQHRGGPLPNQKK
jgi:hypothetical protein